MINSEQYTDEWELELFRERYMRKPRVWDFVELHDLFDKTKARIDNRRKERNDYLNKIIKEIPADENGLRFVYYEYDTGYEKEWHYYEISWSDEWKCWSTIDTWMKFKNLEGEKLRDAKLQFVLSLNEKSVEMGEHLKKLDGLTYTNLHGKVSHILTTRIVNKLRDHFRETDDRPNELFKIDVAGRDYWVKCKDPYNRYYYDFELVTNYDENSITI